MVQQSNSPESQPHNSSEHVFPPLEHAGDVVSPETTEEGQERQAEKQVEKDKPDSQVVVQPATLGNTDTQSVDRPAGQSTQNTGSDTPDIANDVDVIEKAWVDKAKQIIKETKDDPKAQEDAFEQLQIEYHKKRYGRDIKASR